MAFQLAQDLPPFRQGMVRLIDEATKIDTADAQTIWQRVSKSVLCKIRIDEPLYWVIDGLEQSDNFRSFIKMISEPEFACLPIRILVVSRKTQSLSSSFQKLSRDVQLDIIAYEGQVKDIQSYIDQEVEVSGDENFQTRVKSQILERASGNFLWVHLAVQRVNSCHTISNVQNALRQMPPGMEALYDGMANSIASHPQGEDEQLASRILAWVTCALRLLSLEELALALEDEVPRPLDLQRSIGDLCGGFVVVDNGGNVWDGPPNCTRVPGRRPSEGFRCESKSCARADTSAMHALLDGLRPKVQGKSKTGSGFLELCRDIMVSSSYLELHGLISSSEYAHQIFQRVVSLDLDTLFSANQPSAYNGPCVHTTMCFCPQKEKSSLW